MTHPPADDGVLQVVIAVATYRREARLLALLPHLASQAELSPHEARVVVVDNDPEGSAGPMVEAFDSSLVTYLSEPRPGIAAARNCALSEAGDDDLIVFIDDDEVPEPMWLDRMIQAWQRWRSAAVAARSCRRSRALLTRGSRLARSTAAAGWPPEAKCVEPAPAIYCSTCTSCGR